MGFDPILYGHKLLYDLDSSIDILADAITRQEHTVQAHNIYNIDILGNFRGQMIIHR